MTLSFAVLRVTGSAGRLGLVLAAAIAAPALAGLVVAALGPGAGFAVQAALLAAAAGSLTAARLPAGRASSADRVRPMAQLAEGWTEFALVGSEGGQPVGYALAGPLAAAVGAHAFLTASAAVMAVAGTAFAFVPALRTARVPVA